MENIVKDRIVDELTRQEHKALRALVKGYGKLKYASDISNVKTKTLERIAIRGSGLKENIEKIRDKLLHDSV